MKNKFSILIVLLIILSAVAQAKEKANIPPNIIIIFTDEQRRQAIEFWQQLEYQGAIHGVSDPVVTPNLNKLASEGVVFTQAMSTHPLCSPQRAMLLSGLFPVQNGIPNNCYLNSGPDLKEDLKCYSDVLFNAGYNTAYFGKCHWINPTKVFDTNNNYIGTTQWPGGFTPNNYDTYIPPGADRHSHEYWYQVLKDNHFSQYIYSNDPGIINGKSDGEMYLANEFSSKHEARTVIDYLKNTHNQRDANKPFCITWSLNPPHPPYGSTNDCEAESYNLYKNKTHQELFNRPNSTNAASDLNAKIYFANITSVDKYIGQVIDTLDALGLGENTLIIFTSDHGEMLGSHNKMQKNSEYEESFGVPLIMRYKGVLSHKIDDLLIGTTDLYPTFMGLLGLQAIIPNEVLGKNYSDIIKDPQAETIQRPISTPFINIGASKKGVRTDKYTYAVNGTGIVSLFNNINDPYQQNNLALNTLPANDQNLLRQELGYWLKLSEDDWVATSKFPNLIDYTVLLNSKAKLSDKVAISPNPSKGIFNLSSNTEIATYTVFSIAGQLVTKGVGNQKFATIDISDCTNGIYMIKLEDTNGNTEVYKVSKR